VRPDLVVKNGTLVTPTDLFSAAVVIHGERITAVVENSEAPPAERTIDAKDLYVMPGFVDGHVHFREPGFTHRGDFSTESTAAIHGGVTTVVDGPNTGTVVRYPRDVEEKRRIGEAKSHVDFGQLAALTTESVDQIEALAATGVVAMKLFMGYKYLLSGLDLAPPEPGALLEALDRYSRTGLRLSVHAENGDIISALRKRLQTAGRNSHGDHVASRPPYGEADAIDSIIRYCEAAGVRLEIRHLSCAQGVPVVRSAKERGVDVVLETCPHYLTIDSERLRRAGATAIVSPPVRGDEHRGPLLDAIRAGVVDTIGTDHAPNAPEEKLQEEVWKVATGFPGVELAAVLLLTLVNQGELQLTDVVRLYSTNTAKAWDLYPRKGSLLPGADADLAVCDVATRWTVDAGRLHSKHNITPYHGWDVAGRVLYTVVRGRVLLDEGLFSEPRPAGLMVRPWFKGRYRFDRLRGPRLAPGVRTAVPSPGPPVAVEAREPSATPASRWAAPAGGSGKGVVH
jgi:dihydroorotase